MKGKRGAFTWHYTRAQGVGYGGNMQKEGIKYPLKLHHLIY
jgi:hypothetical protein